MRSHRPKPLSSVAVVASDKPKNMTTKNPTLLEIATSFELWMEYADPSGIDSEDQFNSRSASENLGMLQNCGFTQFGFGDLYSDDGFLAAENVPFEFYSSFGEYKPTVRIGAHLHLTEEMEFSEDEMTGPGGWYVVVRENGNFRMVGGKE